VKVFAQESEPVVRAVLFYSPSCPHCHKVINEDLPPLFEKYDKQLEIFGIDVSQLDGQILYQAAIQRFSITKRNQGVPTLVVDDVVLVGSLGIPERFPGLIEQYLAQGGVDWPDIPGLGKALSAPTAEENPTASYTAQPTAHQATPVPATVSPTSVPPTPTPGIFLTRDQNTNWQDKLARDPTGNTLAIIVLIGMLAAVIWSVIIFLSRPGKFPDNDWSCLIPILCTIGFSVAGYLAYVETTQVTAVCGPIGDCNTVQQSEYARLFGILPIGILGLFGYIAISIAWIFARFTKGPFSNLATLSILFMTTSGTLFSIYLTFLEPFVIGATCAWCLTSSIIMTILMLLSVKPAIAVISTFPSSSS